MRVLPNVTIICHVCSTVYQVQNSAGYADGKRFFHQTPTACPACDAPIKDKTETGAGGARDLLLWLYGAGWYRRTYEDIEQLLDILVRNEKDLETYLSLVESMDYDAWEQQVRELARGKLTRDDRDALAAITRARADAHAGTLLPKLRDATRASRERLRLEREKHLQILQSRRA